MNYSSTQALPGARIQLRRVKGWRLPAGALKVDRTTRWGNPFVVGVHGNAARCVELFARLCCGWFTISVDVACVRKQKAFMEHLKAHRQELQGKALACWCRLDAPCHADVLRRVGSGNRMGMSELPSLRSEALVGNMTGEAALPAKETP